MRKTVATNLVVVAPGALTTQYSEAFPTDGLNGVTMDLTVISWYSGATTMTFTVNIQQSADLQTWTNVNGEALGVVVAGTESLAPAYTSVSTTANSTLSTKYVRIKYSALPGTSVTGRVCAATGLNLFSFAT